MDFDQGYITNIHDFGYDRDKTRDHLEEFCQERPVNLVLPLVCSDVERRTVPGILSELNKATFLNRVIVALYAPSREGFVKVARFFRRNLEVPHRIMWCNSPNIKAIMDDLQRGGINLKIQGKGRDTWLALGAASLDSYAIVMHDMDVVNYTYELPMKLAYPLVNPDLDYFFNKGYYSRIGGQPPKFYGRNTRLFLHPLLDALAVKIGNSSDFLQYMRSFKYPLSGEVALTSDLALNIRTPMDWGLEVGTLHEVYRSAVRKRICQTDLGFFEHEHKEVGLDRSEGLLKMAGDILVTLLRALTEEEGLEVSAEFLHSLRVMYHRKAQDSIKQYYADSVCNHLSYNRHEEESMVEAFEAIIIEAGQEYLISPRQARIPDWLRAISAIPLLRRKLIDSIIEDETSIQES
jgi:glucosyl-3-phosphoglycerate synthase